MEVFYSINLKLADYQPVHKCSRFERTSWIAIIKIVFIEKHLCHDAVIRSAHDENLHT